MKFIDTDHKSRLVFALAASAILLPAQILAFLSYHQFASKQLLASGAHVLGYSGTGDLSLAELAYFYEPVFREFFLLVPVASAIIAYVYRNSGWAISFLVFCSLFITFASFVNLLTLADTGNFVAWDLLLEIFEWALIDPGTILDYISPAALILILLFIALPVVISAYINRVSKQNRRGVLLLVLASAAGISVAAAVTLTAAGRLSDANGAIEIKSFTLLQLRTVLDLSPYSRSHQFPDKLTDVIAEFRSWEVTESVGLQAKSALEQAPNSPLNLTRPARNVVFFVMESLPARTITSRLAGGGMPNFAQMSAQSFVSQDHYTTYPYSSDALFSIFTSMYPNRLRRSLGKSGQRLNGIGIFSVLASTGFMTAIYASDRSMLAADAAMFSALGVEQQFPGAGAKEQAPAWKALPDLPSLTNESGQQRQIPEALQDKTLRDQRALDRMLHDIRRASASKERFATAFLPQIGHGPWKPWVKDEPLLKRAENIAAVHDVWLGELLATLDELKILDETIIVVTSDHGPRTVTEYPEIVPWSLNRITFNVPLLIFAPNALERSFALQSASSHIDIMPTVLSLLGMPDEAVCAVGRTVWDPELSDRPLFFLGQQYLGISGVYSDGLYQSYNYLTDNIYRNSSFDFRVASLVKKQQSSGVREFEAALSYQHQFQVTLAEKILEGQSCQGAG